MAFIKNWLEKAWRNIRWAAHVSWLLILYTADRLIDAGGEYAGIIKKEAELFLGAALLFMGFLSFESDKYCDGNTADYLSCTRPATFYYFDALDIFLIVIGVFFILLWFLKRGETGSKR
jgi:hypothetical protein